MVFTVLNKVTSLVNFNFKNQNINQLFFFWCKTIKVRTIQIRKKKFKGLQFKVNL